MGLNYPSRVWVLSTSNSKNDWLLTHSSDFAHHTALNAYCKLKSDGTVEEISKCWIKTNKNIIQSVQRNNNEINPSIFYGYVVQIKRFFLNTKSLKNKPYLLQSSYGLIDILQSN